MLLADGSLADDSKVTTELLAFAGRMEKRLAVETARKEAEIQAGEGEEKLEPGTTARTYFALHDAAAARPGTRRLVHLAGVQRSVQRDLAQEDEGTLVRWSERSRMADKEDVEGDPEVQRIGELKRGACSLGVSTAGAWMFVVKTSFEDTSGDRVIGRGSAEP